MAPLSHAQLQAAQELAQKIFKWEVLSEEHAAVLRTDPNQSLEAYNQCAVNMSPVGSLPPRDQFVSCIPKAELDLENPATTFPERFRAMCTCLFLCRLTMKLAAHEDYAGYLEMKRRRSALHEQHNGTSHVIPPHLPPQLPPLLAGDLAHPPTPATKNSQLQYPMSLPARSLGLEEIGIATRVKVTKDAIAGYRRNPNRLPGHIFVSQSSEGVEAFRVISRKSGGPDPTAADFAMSFPLEGLALLKMAGPRCLAAHRPLVQRISEPSRKAKISNDDV
ncbi:hypothetical protein B0H17DRAFT_1198741 [Mycena rosella]|uniref:Uncharacterized protein n=1 Tax=Mycena rosella TaxID=1033263 RepID=A0AAD7DMY6_MYCRO|nr:hypothetical protein B0H17DRAFT_1198741 [Mycena rosella]